MAVGMCTRAVRLSFPPERVTCFELDKPVIFDINEPILDTMLTLRERALCRRVVVPVDFERPPPHHARDPSGHWAELLVNAGFDPALPSMWMLEGRGGDGGARGRVHSWLMAPPLLCLKALLLGCSHELKKYFFLHFLSCSNTIRSQHTFVEGFYYSIRDFQGLESQCVGLGMKVFGDFWA